MDGPSLILFSQMSNSDLAKRYTLDPMKQILLWQHEMYGKFSNISRTLVGNKIVDHWDVVGASPVVAAPTTSSFST